MSRFPEGLFSDEQIAEWKKQGHWPPDGITFLPEQQNPTTKDLLASPIINTILNSLDPDKRAVAIKAIRGEKQSTNFEKIIEYLSGLIFRQ